jgi:hypothetical protein
MSCERNMLDYILYLQPENSDTGVVLHKRYGYFPAVIENLNVKGQKEKIRIDSARDLKIIQIGNDYIWVACEQYPDGRKVIETGDDTYDDDTKAVHIYNKSMKKILTMQDNVRSLSGAGDDLLVFVKFIYNYAIVSLEQLIESGGKVDKIFKLPEGASIPACATKDKIIFRGDDFNMLICDRSSGNLIKTIKFEKYQDVPFHFILSGKTLYWIDDLGCSVFEMNLETLDYRRITDKPRSGLAVIGNEVILMHKRRLIRPLKGY